MADASTQPGAPAPSAGAPGAPVDAGGSRNVRALVFLRDRGIIILWLVLVAFFAVWAQPYFFTLTNAALVANAAALAGIFAAAVAFGILSGALDLSIPGTSAVAGVVAGLALAADKPVWLAILAAMLTGAAVGYVNGWLVQRGLNALVVTIAMLSALGGVANLLSDGVAITGLTQLTWLGNGDLWGVPSMVIAVGLLFLVSIFWLNQFRSGSRLQAVGSNIEAVRRVGLLADRYRILGFVLSGICGALGGIAVLATTSQASPSPSVDLLFAAITAVALSGMPLTGGRGSLAKVLVGTLIIATINSALIIKGIQPYWTTVITGLLLVGALAFDKVMTSAVTARLTASAVVPDGTDESKQA